MLEPLPFLRVRSLSSGTQVLGMRGVIEALRTWLDGRGRNERVSLCDDQLTLKWHLMETDRYSRRSHPARSGLGRSAASSGTLRSATILESPGKDSLERFGKHETFHVVRMVIVFLGDIMNTRDTALNLGNRHPGHKHFPSLFLPFSITRQTIPGISSAP
jgi:hypothetical protein